jgi:outer membrane receptor protein involved in Fe transport
VEAGHRWQGWNGRVDTSVAGYYVVKNNLNVGESVTTFIQVGEQRSKGLDLDVNTDLCGRAHLIFRYSRAGRPGGLIRRAGDQRAFMYWLWHLVQVS